jgi:transcriptional regulator with PAS, ATPase and Fis domain
MKESVVEAHVADNSLDTVRENSHRSPADRRNISLIYDDLMSERVFGTSAAWRDVLKRAARVAITESTTCLEGESGSGKEVVALFIHKHSPRRRGPFVAINCAALPEQLLESELFGFERRAFTGVQQAKPGQIELASGGVLFLDEVTEMTPAAQAKFLRVLQEREFLRLGGTRAVRANVRVIAATNRSLQDAVARGQFRADLYYRLNVFDIHIPPLRERLEDIPAHALGFLRELNHIKGAPRRDDGRGDGHAPAARLARECPRAAERHRASDHHLRGGSIRPEDLSLDPGFRAPVDSIELEVVERRTIERVMRETNGNKLQSSRRLGISRGQLYFQLRKYGLESPPKEALDASVAAGVLSVS